MITDTELKLKGNQFPDRIVSFEKKIDTLFFRTANNVVLQLTVFRDSVIRLRYSNTGYFENDFSYAITKYASKGYNHLEVSEEKDAYVITTSKVTCRVNKQDLKVAFYDAADGTLINQDELGYHWEESYEFGTDIVKCSKVSHDQECYYGLGDKATHPNLKGRRFENWVTDSYAYGKDTDPIYKAIPFYVGLHQERAYGIFFDNSFRSYFDFGRERKDVTSYWAHGGEMNYYFIYGPEMTDVVASYTDLTGRPHQLPPLWSLGYHQCKWSYYPEAKVKEVTAKFRELQIPCDAIYLDIDYMDGWKCFTWDPERFPDPKRMVKELEDDGFKTVVIIDPGIKIEKGYSVFEEGIANDYFCRRADGPRMKGKVWPGECHFPDYTRPDVREWWSGLFRELIEEVGVRGVWNDMNEPAVMEVPNKTFPDDVRHSYEGNPCSHRKAHNVYGMQMARATYHGLKKFAYPRRPFVITRAGYSGVQRYSSTWTGDNVATWEHLWIANVQMQRLSISGFSFAGSDIGGFAEQPDGELYARWIQLGIFHAFCRTHSSGDHGHQEPWVFGQEITDVVRKFIELRYQLLPYLYTAFWEYLNGGVPIIKSLVFFDQADPQTHHRTDEFIFGNHLMVCPVLEPNSTGRRVYIPRGQWYNYWTQELVDGGVEQRVECDLTTLPMFVKAGSILPKFPVQQYVGEKEIEEVTLEVYHKDGTEVSSLYDDAHDGYDYTKGRYSLRSFKLSGNDKRLTVQQHKSGSFITTYDTFRVQLIGLPFKVKKVFVDQEPFAFDAKQFAQDQTLVVDKNFGVLRVEG